jgi:hypothetical protein
MKNLHLDHLEDLLFIQGTTSGVVSWLIHLRDYILHREDTHMKVSIKWDGSPAFVCGPNPETGQFFIGTKSVFNKKTPKRYYSLEDLATVDDVGLRMKLMYLFETFNEVDLKEIVQGDLLWTTDSVKLQQIGIGWYGVFQPNTLAYAVKPETFQMFRRRCGVVLHTTYKGDKWENLEAHFGWDSKQITSRDWCPNAVIFESDYRKMEQFLEYEYRPGDGLDSALFNSAIHYTGLFEINKGLLKIISETPSLLKVVMKYLNHCVRSNLIPRGWRFADYYFETVGKTLAPGFAEPNEWEQLFKLHSAIENIKNGMVDRLDQSQGIDIFYKDGDTMKPTQHEGYVAYAFFGAVKLVNRSQFSRINMLAEKPWNSTTQPQS